MLRIFRKKPASRQRVYRGGTVKRPDAGTRKQSDETHESKEDHTDSDAWLLELAYPDDKVTESLALARKLQDEMRVILPKTKEQVIAGLDKCQQKALRHVAKTAEREHIECLPKLETRVHGLLPEGQFCMFDEFMRYFRDEAPIIIHIKEETLMKLVNDTHYRNLFETNTSNGSNNRAARKSWERRMFGNAYRRASAFQRPKYGCLNVTGDIEGVRPARRTYGSLYLVLASHVRHRCTFSEKDSSSSTCTVSTNEFIAHTLWKYSDSELRTLIYLSRSVGGANKCHQYKEVQIHGPVDLTCDIEALSVTGKACNASARLSKTVEQFQAMSGCNVFWQDDIYPPIADPPPASTPAKDPLPPAPTPSEDPPAVEDHAPGHAAPLSPCSSISV